ncbi:MAG: DUF3445 domain-containing protein [Pseudomonadota bacterium]
MLPKHTPFTEPSSSFSIGLQPLDLKHWIEVDNQLPLYLHQKQRLMKDIPDLVWAGDFSSERAQNEVLDLLVLHLLDHFPDFYQSVDKGIAVKDVGWVDLEDISRPPLVSAALLVQEDLVIMRKSPAGWRLVAGSVCFPSSWVLREKIGKVMHDVHAPVPGFGEGSRNAIMIERIFDNLLVEQPVERFNWSVYNDDELYHDDRAGEHFPDNDAVDGNQYFLRIEHQTLRKLPHSDDILFTIRIHVDPVEMLAKREDRAVLIPAFIKTIRSMDEEQMTYKGFMEGSELLIRCLEQMR